MLKRQYEMFAIEDHEFIQFMVSCLQVILNSLRSLGSTISQYEINDKILRILPTKIHNMKLMYTWLYFVDVLLHFYFPQNGPRHLHLDVVPFFS